MLGQYFELSRRGSSLRIEVVAGVTTFLTMAYVIFVHPNILGATGMDKNALIAVTCIITAAATVATGIFGRAPIAMAPGMGLNAYFAVTLVGSGKASWQTGLGVVFLSGLFFWVLTLVGLRRRLVEAIPRGLISAISVGIGLFIALIGLGNLGLVVRDERTLFAFGGLSATVLIGLSGLGVMILLELLRVRGSLLIGIAVATIIGALFGHVAKPGGIVSLDWRLGEIAFELDILGALKWSLLGSIFTLMFIDMFDSIGTLVACCAKAQMRDRNDQIRGLDRLLGIDAAATMVGAVLGTSTTTSYVESAAGIEQGGRTGVTAIVAGVLFLFALFFVPLIAIVPPYATAPAQIMVGLFMMREIKRIPLGDLDQSIPSIIVVLMIAVSYMISAGLALGFVSFVLIKIVRGRAGQVKPAMWVIALLSVLFLVVDYGPKAGAAFSSLF